MYENNLKTIRNQKKITLRELALLTGISKTHISEIENKKSDMTVTIMCLLANSLNVEPCKICKCNKK